MFIVQQHALAVPPGQLGLAWTGQAGFALKSGSGQLMHIDPYLSNACSRFVGYHRAIPAPVAAEEVRTDFLLITHEHRDHLDPDSVPAIVRRNPNLIVACPPSCVSELLAMGVAPAQLTVMRRGSHAVFGDFSVHAVMAHHTEDSVGYVIELASMTVYLTGDTTYADDLIGIAKFKPDLMLTCINGRLGCMGIPDAARLAAHLQPAFVVPMHIHMFRENTADPQEFVRQAEAYSGITKGFIMEHGRWYLFDRTRGFLTDTGSGGHDEL